MIIIIIISINFLNAKRAKRRKIYIKSVFGVTTVWLLTIILHTLYTYTMSQVYD